MCVCVSEGGGLCIFVNNSWATQFCVRETVSTKGFEIVAVSIRPFYLPREFRQVTVILVSVPGPNNARAAQRIARSFNKAVSQSVAKPVFLLGDFLTPRTLVYNHLPHLEQFGTFPTRDKRTSDNVTGAFPTH